MNELIQVKYRNSQEGCVDDVTLNELIISRKIKNFYRPSQEKWIDIETTPVRICESPYSGPERRKPDEEEESEQLEEKAHGLPSRLSRDDVKPIAPKKELTAEDWFERGVVALYNKDDSGRALRAFAKSIHLDDNHMRAYFNRGITYERVGNLQQAIDDYSKSIELAPGDPKFYYVRGLAHKRLGMDDEAIEDFEKAACIEKPKMPDMVTLRHRSGKSLPREKKKRKNLLSLIVSLGVFCALILVLMAFFFWPTIPDDYINSMGKIYPPRINKPTAKSVIVPPLEDTKPKGQTEIISIMRSSNSSNGLKYSIQIRAYRETDINAATEFVSDLRKRQPDVHMERVYIQGRGVWYRILLGHFANIEEASTYMKEKVFKEYPGSFVQLTSERQSPRKEPE